MNPWDSCSKAQPASRSPASGGVSRLATSGAWLTALLGARWLSFSLLGLLAAHCGCNSLPLMSWQKMPLEAEAGLYKSVDIAYYLDAGRLTLPISVARVEGQRVSYEEVVTRPEAGCAGGRLVIHYPHPDGRTDFAEARLVIDRDPRKPVVFWKPNSWRFRGPKSPAEEASHEEWRLDLAKADLDALINEMRGDGCFTQDQPNAKAAQLTIGFNGHHRTKPWSQSAPLESCMQRVRREGSLIALKRPATAADSVSMTSSLESYRSLVAQGGGGDPPVGRAVAVSGLIMPKAPAATIAPAIPYGAVDGPMIADASPPSGPAAPTGYQPPPYNQSPYNPAPFNQAAFNAAGQPPPSQAPLNQAPFGQTPFSQASNAPFYPPPTAEVARVPGGPR